MKLKFFYPLWGSIDIPFDKFCQKVKEAGFNGVEFDPPLDKGEKKYKLDCLKDFELELIGQYWQSIAKDFNQHYQDQEMYLRNLVSASPLFINSQTGKDYYTFDQNRKLIELCQKIEQESGITILHETHRGKFSFAAHITKDYLQNIPNMKLTLDISHWCNVHESLLEDQAVAVELAVKRTYHIHSRIGHQQGPQINAPQAPEWEDATNFHLDCWKKVALNHKRMNAETLHITTEFGPFPYLPSTPYSLKPLNPQWDSNIYMKDLLTTTLSPILADKKL